MVVVADLAAVTFFLLSWSRHGVSFGPYRIDLDVYRIGGRVWLAGQNLYGVIPKTSAGRALPFSYPPVAAVLMSPLSLLPAVVATTLVTLLTVGLTALVLRTFLRSLATGPARAARERLRPAAGTWWTVALLLPAALFGEPVRSTLNFGQVNVLLMALVAADCLTAAPRWPRGVLVGVAAAVKLTPAVFVLFFLLRRDRRAAGTAGLSFAACAAAGFLLAWRDSVEYWTHVIFQASRPGSPLYAGNQSIEGLLARAGLASHSPAGAAAWLAASAVVVLVAAAGMRRALAAAADAWALSLNALAGLLISPISWSHHWVWGETAVLALGILSWRSRLPGPGGVMPSRTGLALAAAGAAMFAAAPQWRFPHGGSRELGWAIWEQVLGSSYVVYAVIVLAAACVLAQARGKRPALPRRQAPATQARAFAAAALAPGTAEPEGTRSLAPPAPPRLAAAPRLLL